MKCFTCGKSTRSSAGWKYCDKCSKFLIGLSGRDLNREVWRIKNKHTCKECKRKWKVGERRFDIHHVIQCGKKSRGYDTLKELEETILVCHRCHYNLPEHRCKSEAFAKVLRRRKSTVKSY